MIQTFNDEDNKALIDRATAYARRIAKGTPSPELIVQVMNSLLLQDVSIQIRNLNLSNDGMMTEVMDALNNR